MRLRTRVELHDFGTDIASANRRDRAFPAVAEQGPQPCFRALRTLGWSRVGRLAAVPNFRLLLHGRAVAPTLRALAGCAYGFGPVLAATYPAAWEGHAMARSALAAILCGRPRRL